MTFHMIVADSPEVISLGLAVKATITGAAVVPVDEGTQAGKFSTKPPIRSSSTTNKSDFPKSTSGVYSLPSIIAKYFDVNNLNFQG